MLCTVFPLSSILASIWVCICPFSVLLIHTIIAFISSAVLPHVVTVAMHDTVLEHPFEVSSVRPFEISKSTHLIIRPHARIFAAISPEINTMAFFHSFHKVAKIVTSIAPNLNSFAILFILVNWGRSVHPTHCKILMDVMNTAHPENTEVGWSILLPVALKAFLVWFRCPKNSNTSWLSIDPKALKCALIGPNLFPIATLCILEFRLLLMVIWSFSLLIFVITVFWLLVAWHDSHLSNISDWSEFHWFDSQLSILEA